MLIQKLNLLNTQRFQAKGQVNQQKNYMNNINTSAKGDTVSFGLNLDPKIISPELNNLFGRALTKITSEQSGIVEALNKPLKDLLKRSDLSFETTAKEFTLDDVKNLVLNREFKDGTQVKFSKSYSKAINGDYLTIKVAKGDENAIIEIQDNCVSKVSTKKGKLFENNAFISDDVLPEQIGQLRFGVKKEKISKYGESSKLNELETEIKNCLWTLLD